VADPLLGAVAAIGAAITSASGAVSAATLALTGSAGLAAAAGNAVLGLASWKTALYAAGFAATALLTPSVNIEGSPTQWRADPNAGIPFVIGEAASGGVIVHRDAYGKDNHVQSIVTVYSGAGPIAGFDEFSADDVAMNFGANGAATNGGAFADNMWLQTSLGAQPQAAALSQSLNAKGVTAGSFQGWGASSRISGKAHALLTLRDGQKRPNYPAGEPRALMKMRGISFYDPRLDSTVAGGSGAHRVGDPSTFAYSQNPAIAALNWCLGLRENGVVVGGIGASVDGVDLPAFIEWANTCDANGWTISAVPTSADDKHQVLLAMMQAGGARYARYRGRISCIVRAPKTSVVTLGSEDTAGPFELDLGADRLTRTNTVLPRCVMESHRWEMVAQDSVTEAAYVSADGGERPRGIDYPYVTVKADGSNRHQPAQLAAYAIVDSREALAGTVPLKPWGAQIRPGDVFTISDPEFLLDGVELLCLRRELDLVSGLVSITFISETAGKHDYALGLDPVPPAAPGLTAPDLYAIDPPEIGVWGAVAGGGRQPSIIVTGDANDAPNARGFRVEYRTRLNPATGAVWTDPDAGWVVFSEFDLATERVTITGLEPNTAYEVAVSYISQYGILGTRLDPPLQITTDAMVADDATRPSQDIAAFMAEMDATAADLAEVAANLKARFNALLVDGQAGSESDASSAIEGAVDRLNMLSETIAEARRAGDAAVNARVTRTDAPGGNLDPDPKLGLGFPAHIAPAAGTEGVGGTLDQPLPTAVWRWSDIPDARTDAVVLNDIDPVEVRPGQKIELAADMDTLGVLQNPRLRLVWLDANGAEIATPAEVALSGGFIRGGSWDITVPAGAAKMQRQFVAGSSAAGSGHLLWRDPMWKFAEEGQAGLTPVSDRESQYVSSVRQLTAASRNLSVLQNTVIAEVDRVRAQVEQIISAEAGEAFALASDVTEVRTLVGTLEAQVVSLQQALNTGAFAEVEDLRALQVTVGDANAIEDYTLMQGAAGTLRSLGGVLGDDDTSDPRAARVQRAATASGQVVGMAIADPFSVLEGGRLGWAVDVEAFGPVGQVRLGVFFFAADGSVAADLEANSVSGSGWIGRDVAFGIVTVPAGARFAAPYVLATSTAAGDIGLRIRRLGSGAMAAGETGPFPWSAAPRKRVLEAYYQQRATQSLVQQVEAQRLAAGATSARIEEANALRALGDGVQAERSAVIEGQIGTPTGGTIFGRLGTLDQLVIDLGDNKLEVSTFQTIETQFDALQSSYNAFVVSTTDALAQRVTVSQFNSQTAVTDQLRSEYDAFVVTTTDNLAGKASASALQALQVQTDALDASYQSFVIATNSALDGKASTTAVQTAQASADGADAKATTALGAVAEVEGAAVFFEVLLAASGSDPALVRALAGKNGSEVGLAAASVWLANMVSDGQGGFSPAKVIEVTNQIATVLTRLRLGPNAVFDTADGRMEIGKLSKPGGGFGAHFKTSGGASVLLLDVENQEFNISQLAAANGFLGRRTFVQRKNVSLIPNRPHANGQQAQADWAATSNRTVTAFYLGDSTTAHSAGDEIEVRAEVSVTATGDLFNHMYWRLDLIRFTEGGVYPDEVIETNPEYWNMVNIASNASSYDFPETSSIHTIDIIPSGMPADTQVGYRMRVSPSNVLGAFTAFEGYGDSAGAKNLQIARGNLIVHRYGRNLFLT
jgi:hypothetical protein